MLSMRIKVTIRDAAPIFKELLALCSLFPLRTVLAMLLVFSTSATVLLLPMLFKWVLEKLSHSNLHEAYSMILLSIIFYCVIWTVKDISEQLREIIFTRPIQYFMKNLTLRMFNSILLSSVSTPSAQVNIGSFFDCIVRLRESFSGMIWGALFHMFPTFIEITIGCFIIHYYYGWRLSVVILLSVFVFLLFTLSSLQTSVKHQKRVYAASSESNNYLMDRLNNLMSIIVHNKEAYERYNYGSFLETYANAQAKKIVFFEKIRLLQGLIVGISLTVTTLILFNGIVARQYGIADFVMLNAYLVQFLSPLSYVGHIMEDIRDGMTTFKESLKYLRPAEPKKSVSKTQTNLVFKNLYIDNVSYSVQEKFILQNIKLDIYRGMKILIVGSSGSGKTTLLKIIAKLLFPTKGKLIFNDSDITQVKLDGTTRFTSYLPQEVSLFNESIFYNVAYSKTGATLHEVEYVLKKVYFIRKNTHQIPNLLSQNVSTLSGGEKQKILLARLLLENRHLVLMDEPFASLDEIAGSRIMNTLFQEQCDKTIIMSSHKIIKPQLFDLIIQMDKGKIYARGNHEQMLIRSIFYKQAING